MYKTAHAFSFSLLKESVANDVINVSVVRNLWAAAARLLDGKGMPSPPQEYHDCCFRALMRIDARPEDMCNHKHNYNRHWWRARYVWLCVCVEMAVMSIHVVPVNCAFQTVSTRLTKPMWQFVSSAASRAIVVSWTTAAVPSHHIVSTPLGIVIIIIIVVVVMSKEALLFEST